jgi:thiol-disulfide isomerase/thioredoxin
MTREKIMPSPSHQVVPSGADAGQGYRFEHLALSEIMKDMRFSASDPAPGEHIPEFDLPVVGGGRFRSRQLGELPVLLIFGSSTCPATDSAAPGLNDLHRSFGDAVRFVLVNVREAHPGESVSQPRTLEAKMDNARRMRALHGIAYEVAVDDLDGTLHRALSPKPNSAYLIGTDGAILFRAHWANDTAALRTALEQAAGGTQVSPTRSGGVASAMLRMLRYIPGVLDRAGRKAWTDMWRIATPLAAVAYVLKALRLADVPRLPAAQPTEDPTGAARERRA